MFPLISTTTTTTTSETGDAGEATGQKGSFQKENSGEETGDFISFAALLGQYQLDKEPQVAKTELHVENGFLPRSAPDSETTSPSATDKPTAFLQPELVKGNIETRPIHGKQVAFHPVASAVEPNTIHQTSLIANLSVPPESTLETPFVTATATPSNAGLTEPSTGLRNPSQTTDSLLVADEPTSQKSPHNTASVVVENRASQFGLPINESRVVPDAIQPPVVGRASPNPTPIEVGSDLPVQTVAPEVADTVTSTGTTDAGQDSTLDLARGQSELQEINNVTKSGTVSDPARPVQPAPTNELNPVAVQVVQTSDSLNRQPVDSVRQVEQEIDASVENPVPDETLVKRQPEAGSHVQANRPNSFVTAQPLQGVSNARPGATEIGPAGERPEQDAVLPGDSATSEVTPVESTGDDTTGFGDSFESSQQSTYRDFGHIGNQGQFADIVTASTSPNATPVTPTGIEIASSINTFAYADNSVVATQSPHQAESAIAAADVIGQVSRAIDISNHLPMLGLHESSRMEIALEPRELGSLTVEVQITDEVAKVSIVAEQATSHAILEKNIGLLIESLQQQEAMPVHVDVSHRDANEDNGNRDPQTPHTEPQESKNTEREAGATVSRHPDDRNSQTVDMIV